MFWLVVVFVCLPLCVLSFVCVVLFLFLCLCLYVCVWFFVCLCLLCLFVCVIVFVLFCFAVFVFDCFVWLLLLFGVVCRVRVFCFLFARLVLFVLYLMLKVCFLGLHFCGVLLQLYA